MTEERKIKKDMAESSNSGSNILSSVHQLPLRGRHLIDASAGTGKTYTISGLVLRLLLERNFTVRDILVVTYTEAASEDLRERVREKIKQALHLFEGGESSEPFLTRLVAGQPDSAAARSQLRAALRDFDEAAIFTIHGFCQRVLRENSLETGTLFEADLVVDERPLIQELVEDYWRREVYQGPALRVAYLAGKLDPGRLIALLGHHLHSPFLRVIPQPALDEAGLEAIEERFLAALDSVQAAWPEARRQVGEILANDPGLNRNRYRPASIPRWLEAMDGLCPSPELFDGFERFTMSGLAAGVKNGWPVPEHPFFTLCENLRQTASELLPILEEQLLAFQAGLFSYVRREMKRRKQERAVYSFDDLLLQVHHSLQGAGGRRLAGFIRRRYPAALIDEFQDTDPVQYEIFAAIYQGPEVLLFLIGDPKQAIYSFRGADIFAYFRACREVDSRYGLGTNHRSTPGLVRAVNLLFSGPRVPFFFDEIDFAAVEPARAEARESLFLDGLAPEPFQLWLMARQEQNPDPLPAGEARERILRAVAAEIVRLLEKGREGRGRLNGRPLAAGDIAVLVRSNREARLMQETLTACGVPGVLHGMENLFATREAAEMARLLAAVADPGDENKVRLALVTGICGLNGAWLAALAEDEAAWEERLLTFRQYHETWRDHGFIRMLRLLMRREGVRPRLLGLPDGERRLTNLLHLTEVLHRAAARERPGMAGLRRFLSERLGTADEQVEEYLLRLESDAERVRIITIHKAKGLQYPIVFCPFCWQGTRKAQPPFVFHHREGDCRLTLDLGSAERDLNLEAARREELAENLRLLYVALTRAQERCYLVWGGFKGAETSALAYLLHQSGGGTPDERRAAAAARVSAMNDGEMRDELEKLAAGSGGAMGLAIIGEEVPAAWHPGRMADQGLTGRSFTGRISSAWRVTSYSGLVHSSRPHRLELPDRDRISSSAAGSSGIRQERSSTAEPLSIFDFPQGAGPGIFLHELMEHLDFTCIEAGARERLVKEKLEAHGHDQVWAPPLLVMLDQVLRTPLSSDWPGLTLSAVPPVQRLDELEFHFPLAAARADDLAAVFAAGGTSWLAGTGERLAQLSWPGMRGFCKGFIDLVFTWKGRYFMIDWKSNFLGPRLEDYHRSRLEEVMVRELYTFQYHLYLIALNRYLAGRLPGYRYRTHFGGVFYLFLRGMDCTRGADYGIFHDLPEAGLLEKMEQALCGGGRPDGKGGTRK